MKSTPKHARKTPFFLFAIAFARLVYDEPLGQRRDRGRIRIFELRP